MLPNRFGLGSLCLFSALLFTSPVKAETCRALNVIGGEGTKVTKTVSPLSTLVTNNNWNTDFSVPGGRANNRYVATLVSNNDAAYDIKLNLKYSNNTADELYAKNSQTLKVGQPFKISGEPRAKNEPYQINVFVGGLSAIGNTLTLSVDACY